MKEKEIKQIFENMFDIPPRDMAGWYDYAFEAEFQGGDINDENFEGKCPDKKQIQKICQEAFLKQMTKLMPKFSSLMTEQFIIEYKNMQEIILYEQAFDEKVPLRSMLEKTLTKEQKEAIKIVYGNNIK